MKNIMNLEESLELSEYLRNPYEKVALNTIISYYQKENVNISEFRAVLRTIDNKRFKTEMKIRKNPQIPDIEKDYLTYKLLIRRAIVSTMKNIIRTDSIFKLD